MRKQTTWDLEI
jgi:hypothetical protein